MTDGQTDAQPGRRVSYVADLACLLCGTAVGHIESERRTLPNIATFHPVGDKGPGKAVAWRNLRCPRCNGGVVAESVEEVVQPEAPADWRAEAPRRGRPPKWLVEQRARERERHVA